MIDDYPYKENEWYMNQYTLENIEVIHALLQAYEKFKDQILITIRIKSDFNEPYLFDLSNVYCYLYYRPFDKIVAYNIDTNKTLDSSYCNSDFYDLKEDFVNKAKSENEKSIEFIKMIESLNNVFIEALKKYKND